MITPSACIILACMVLLPFQRPVLKQPEPTAQPAQVAIFSPSQGQALQGIVLINGIIPQEKFKFAELSFAYEGDRRDNWFLIAEFDTPSPDKEMATWDTTLLTDGEYLLRLVVTLEDGKQIVTVPGLRIRNYTPIETDTPFPTTTQAPGDTPFPTITPLPTQTTKPPTITPLPPNPAEINSSDIFSSFGKGILIVVGLFAILGLYQTAKGLRRGDRR